MPVCINKRIGDFSLFFFLFLFFLKKVSCIINAINNPPRLWDCPGALRGSSVRPSVCLLRTCDSTSVKRRRLAPPPLLSHNIRDKVTVCCGLRTLITRQENNVEGKAFHHHQRSLNPPGDSAGLSSGFTPLTRRRVWLTATEQISLNNKREKKLHLAFPFFHSL